MNEQNIIRKTEKFVKNVLKDAEGGHDWWHSLRVRNLAVKISETENGDSFIIELGALLHDIADSKFYGGDEEVGPRLAGEYLSSLDIDRDCIIHIQNIIANISFKGGTTRQSFRSPELDVIQDADRLDAIGAIGIARTFNYGGFKGRELYNPEIPPKPGMSREEYKSSTAPTINHFYEKLLLLKDLMNTATGRRMAEARHGYMEGFLNQFYGEWNGEK